MYAHELDCVISSRRTFIDAQLASLTPSQRQTGRLDLRQSHPGHAFLLDWQRADRAGGTNLPAVVAGRFTSSPIRDNPRSPETLQTVFKSHRLKNIIGAGLKTFAATDA